MNIERIVRKMKKRFNQFWKALMQKNMFVIREREVPTYYFLLYDKEEMAELQEETIRQLRESLNGMEEDNRTNGG